MSKKILIIEDDKDISRHLERIADHSTNIAEDVVYLVEGIDIRHHSEENR